jgi:N-acetylglutamate synthase-like GNAT family acetyltransferase
MGDVRDASALHALISANVEPGWLLPRAFDELQRHAPRFLVMNVGEDLIACAELAPLSNRVAEIRSLVVDARHRGSGFAGRLVRAIRRRARAGGYERLCAFAHDPRPFLGWGF